MNYDRQAAALSLLSGSPQGGTLAGNPIGDGENSGSQQKAARFKGQATAAGTAIGALIGAYFGNPMLGAQLGGAAGGAGAGFLTSGDGGAQKGSSAPAQNDIYNLVRAVYLASGPSDSGAAGGSRGPLPPMAGPSGV